MRLKFRILIGMLLYIVSCCKDDISKGEASTHPSFSNPLHFNAVFNEEHDDLYYFRFDHWSQETGLLYRIEMQNILLVEDTNYLYYFKEGPFEDFDIPTAKYYVLIDEDSQGEYYVIDSSNFNKESYVVLDCISNSHVSGKFDIKFVLAEDSSPKLAPNIPDTFYVNNSLFNAKKLK